MELMELVNFESEGLTSANILYICKLLELDAINVRNKILSVGNLRSTFRTYHGSSIDWQC